MCGGRNGLPNWESGLPDGARIVDGIEVNPKADTIDRLASEGRQADIEVVVGVGGGQCIGCGEGHSHVAYERWQYCSIRRSEPGSAILSAPFIAVPTTCGTGSEVTWVSVVSVPSTGSKISVKGRTGCFRKRRFVDADVLATLPTPLIASTGMDAMTHAIEAFISRVNNPASDALALQAIRLLIQHLGPCVREPNLGDHRAHVIACLYHRWDVLRERRCGSRTLSFRRNWWAT